LTSGKPQLAERAVRGEVTDRMLIARSRRLRAVLDEYVAHFNRHRPHGARNLRPPDRDDVITPPEEEARCQIVIGPRLARRLGGVG